MNGLEHGCGLIQSAKNVELENIGIVKRRRRIYNMTSNEPKPFPLPKIEGLKKLLNLSITMKPFMEEHAIKDWDCVAELVQEEIIGREEFVAWLQSEHKDETKVHHEILVSYAAGFNDALKKVLERVRK
jgi:hypothetical protein